MTVWGSIEDETPFDISDLKIVGITTREQLNLYEAKNINKVVLKYLGGSLTRRRAKFDYPWCFKLHQQMFCDVWTWAGCARTRELNIGDAPHAIPENFANLLADLESWPGYNWPFIEQATHLHHRAVKIHPFPNGNGRWSRMLANIWLHLHKQPIILWPENLVGAKSPIRSEYIAAIKKADDHDYDDLIAMHEKFADRR